MLKITIDGNEIEVPKGYTVLQAAEAAGVEIPIFCYHPRLDIAGNCRMCLVDLEGSPKPIASCAMPAADGMVINTKSAKTIKARKGALEFLLANHPLDCPICDQGGECDLQDITMAYGAGKSRFAENKRSVIDKNLGPLVKTVMNRCIHCTRCIRFVNDVAGVAQMGAIFRGEDMQITTYLEQSLTSELSGNVVDLCPVGALTSKPYMFKGRPWDLKKTNSIDVMDGVGSHIRVDSIGNKVVRVLPRVCEDINEEWISDKTRHACDGLSKQRLDRPYVKKVGKLAPIDWQGALKIIGDRINSLDNPNKMAALAGSMADVESMFLLKKLFHSFGSYNMDCNSDGAHFDPKVRASYTFNSGISGIDQANCILIIGTNLRKDAPIINARIRQNYLNNATNIYRLGGKLSQSLTYPVNDLGDDIAVLEDILSGKHEIAAKLKKATYPMIIVGREVMIRSDNTVISKLLYEICQKYGVVKRGWNGYNVLHRSASSVGGMDIGFTPRANKGKSAKQILSACRSKNISLLYLLGEDEININEIDPSVFVIYQGSHGDYAASRADVILPSLAYTEKQATYVNTEGRVQSTQKAINGPMVDFNIQAKEDWKIIRALSDYLGKSLMYTDLKQVREGMAADNPIFNDYGVLQDNQWQEFGKAGTLIKAKLHTPDYNFYMTDVISRNSPTMALCTKEFHLKAA